uniref:DUF4228 domain-containing protein n=1 Tax=Oryza meridionalis TaxID=40149 RepID=A0A0E0E302_9ORYZ
MASWLFCSGKAAARGEFVKLVFPGGHVELLDRAVPAAEVMARHPRFCVARPDVFRDPAAAGAVVAPDAVLALGRKYYVVPRSTVRRLQIMHASSSSSPHAGGGVSLKRHLAGSGGHERGYKVVGRRKSWLRLLVGGGGKPQPSMPRDGGVSHGGKDEAAVVGNVGDVRETKENGKPPRNGGSPARRRRRLASPASSASYSWQPSLHSITEE